MGAFGVLSALPCRSHDPQQDSPLGQPAGDKQGWVPVTEPHSDVGPPPAAVPGAAINNCRPRLPVLPGLKNKTKP